MSSESRLAVLCSAERKLLGWITGEPETKVTVKFLKGPAFKPAPDFPVHIGLAPKVGVMMLCPNCGSRVVYGLDGQDLKDVIADSLSPNIGSFYLPAKMRRRYKRGEPTPDPLRASPLITDAPPPKGEE